MSSSGEAGQPDTPKVRPGIRIVRIVAPEIVKTDVENFRSVVQILTGQKRRAGTTHMKREKRQKVTKNKTNVEASEDSHSSGVISNYSPCSSSSSFSSVRLFLPDSYTCIEKPSSTHQCSSAKSDIENSFKELDISSHFSPEQELQIADFGGIFTDKQFFPVSFLSTDSVNSSDFLNPDEKSPPATITGDKLLVSPVLQMDVLRHHLNSYNEFFARALPPSELEPDIALSGAAFRKNSMLYFSEASMATRSSFNEVNTCPNFASHDMVCNSRALETPCAKTSPPSQIDDVSSGLSQGCNEKDVLSGIYQPFLKVSKFPSAFCPLLDSHNAIYC